MAQDDDAAAEGDDAKLPLQMGWEAFYAGACSRLARPLHPRVEAHLRQAFMTGAYYLWRLLEQAPEGPGAVAMCNDIAGELATYEAESADVKRRSVS